MTELTAPAPTTARTSLRFLTLGALALAMSIPLLLVSGVSSERQGFFEQAKATVASAWGGAQTVAGPFLLIDESYPCKKQTEDKGPVTTRCKTTRVFLPGTLNIASDVQHQIRRKAIYDIPVYTSDTRLKGLFAPPSSDARATLHYETARLAIGLTHTQAVAEPPTVEVNRKPATLRATSTVGWLPSGLHVPLTLEPGSQVAFDIQLAARGTDSLTLTALGDVTEVEARSTWPHPAFGGRYLPDESEVRSDGFTAAWTVHELARGLPSSWRGQSQHAPTGDITIRLHPSITDHRLVDRGIKYGLLFVALTFLTLLCFELSAKVRFHPVQYGVVGIALTLFYLALLSLSEHIPFGAAYAIASAIVIALITGYVWGITRRRLLTGWIAGIVSFLYATLFTLLSLEDYALLAGTALLFAGLAALMVTTRSLTQEV